MRYKLVKKSKNKIKCVRDENSGTEIFPSDLNLSDNLCKINAEILDDALHFIVSPPSEVHLFDFLNDINQLKENLIEGNEKVYVPFVINKILSYSQDCLFHINEINIRGDLEKTLQYKYLSNSIRKKKRFNKVHKFSVDEDILIISKLHNLSERVAKQILDVIYTQIETLPNIYKEAYKQL